MRVTETPLVLRRYRFLKVVFFFVTDTTWHPGMPRRDRIVRAGSWTDSRATQITLATITASVVGRQSQAVVGAPCRKQQVPARLR